MSSPITTTPPATLHGDPTGAPRRAPHDVPRGLVLVDARQAAEFAALTTTRTDA